MNLPDRVQQVELPLGDRSEKMMVSGRVRLAQGDGPLKEARRGMMIRTRDGREAGMVAAVITDDLSQNVSHILLCQLPVTSDYRLIPVNLIDRMDEETIHLNIPNDDVKELPLHQPD